MRPFRSRVAILRLDCEGTLRRGVRLDHVAVAVDDQNRCLVRVEQIPVERLGAEMGLLGELGGPACLSFGGHPLTDENGKRIEQHDLGKLRPHGDVVAIADGQHESRNGEDRHPSRGERGAAQPVVERGEDDGHEKTAQSWSTRAPGN